MLEHGKQELVLRTIRDNLIEIITITQNPELKKVYDKMLQTISRHLGVWKQKKVL